ncbi:uncharacterized protein LOC127282409 isoform X1 [Leptopilina boulardi]|uniref:uncharacterized protein LOC127282409 isoform X1 n=1 Tax=Leptopilina boulardi TaxID=63433 RepID=UPI0021F60865|nr:uncharacterized protein LOC127282409 isoform X1 [Leptopilina boulardi]
MNFVFLPFLFAWNPAPQDEFKYGPVYIFDMEINMIAAMNTDNGSILGTRVSGELKCRPHLSDTTILICRTEDTKIIRTYPNGFNTTGIEIFKNESYSPYGLGHDLYQVKFNNEGIENYGLESNNDDASKWIIDMIRLITNQLSIGFQLENRRNDEQFKKLENFTVGECETEFKISRKKQMNNNNNNNNGEPKIIPIFDQSKFIFGPYDEIEIEKRRNIQNCPRHKEYFFGTRYNKGIVLKDVYNKLISSTSQIIFSTTNFMSETTNECEIFDMDRNRLGKVLDHIKLKLKNGEPAKEEFVSITNATFYDTLAGESVVDSGNNYKN